MRHRFHLPCLAVFALMLAAPGGAWAADGKVDVFSFASGDQIKFTAPEDATANRLAVSTQVGQVTLEDSKVIVLTPAADVLCDRITLSRVVCTGSRIIGVRADLKGGDDSYFGSGPLRVNVNGDDGADTVNGGPGIDDISGGRGHDTLFGNGGDDLVSAQGEAADSDEISLGAGSDTLLEPGPFTRADLGADDDALLLSVGDDASENVAGGLGFDRIEPSDRSRRSVGLTVNLTAGTLVEKTPAVVTDVITGFEELGATLQGGDTITGTAGPNILRTGPNPLFAPSGGNGDDVVNPLGGADLVETGAGNDRITAADGFQDRVRCGPGFDTVDADPADQLDGCESVTVKQGPAGPAAPAGAAAADRRAPTCSFVKAAKKAKRSTFLKGYAVTLRCDEKVTLTGQIKAAGVILTERSTASAAGSAKGLKLKPPQAARKLLGRRFTARVVIQARDEFGNTRTLTRKVKVATPKRKAR